MTEYDHLSKADLIALILSLKGDVRRLTNRLDNEWSYGYDAGYVDGKKSRCDSN